MVENYFQYEDAPIDERIDAITSVVEDILRRKVITKKQLEGYVIDLFSYEGAVPFVLRPYGGQLTVVEAIPSCIELGIKKGFINPQQDIIFRDGIDVEEYLNEMADVELNADLITALGTKDTYFKDPYQFHIDAMKCLKPGGVLFMTGTYHMKGIFTDFREIFKGNMQNMGKYSHPWDVFQYYAVKK